MAELVDAQVSDACIARCGGSSPFGCTNFNYFNECKYKGNRRKLCTKLVLGVN
jgi:hypothetical protein